MKNIVAAIIVAVAILGGVWMYTQSQERQTQVRAGSQQTIAIWQEKSKTNPMTGQPY